MTLFTWGYFGWGNATEHLVRIVDRVEAERGFRPPLFVDTRIRRSVRAQGFQGDAFGKLLGSGRHRWMQGLGNEAIRTREGGIRISDPARAEDLLHLALDDPSRRVLFFCSCQWPRLAGQVVCHRCAVANLVLEAAGRRGEAVEVVEWPGGAPAEAVCDVTSGVLASLLRGRTSIPLGTALPGADLGGLAWGSIVLVSCENKEGRVISGPARHRAGAWELPVLERVADGMSDEAVEARVGVIRRSFGLEARRSLE